MYLVFRISDETAEKLVSESHFIVTTLFLFRLQTGISNNSVQRGPPLIVSSTHNQGSHTMVYQFGSNELLNSGCPTPGNLH